jgi:hypothetical protein
MRYAIEITKKKKQLEDGGKHYFATWWNLSSFAAQQIIGAPLHFCLGI